MNMQTRKLEQKSPKQQKLIIMKTLNHISRTAGSRLTLILILGLFTSFVLFQVSGLVVKYSQTIDVFQQNPVVDRLAIQPNPINNGILWIEGEKEEIEAFATEEMPQIEDWMMDEYYYDDFAETEPEVENWMFDLNYYDDSEYEEPEIEDWMFMDPVVDYIDVEVLSLDVEPDYDVLEILPVTAVFPGVNCQPFLHSLLVSSPDFRFLVKTY